MIKKLNKGDIVICSELSRLGRSLFMILDVLSLCMKKEIKLWTIKDNYRLGNDIESKVLAFAFGLSAEIERNLISQRTKEALARVKAEGRHLGRQFGSKNQKHILDSKLNELHVMQSNNISKTEIAKRLKVSRATIQRYYSLLDVEVN